MGVGWKIFFLVFGVTLVSLGGSLSHGHFPINILASISGGLMVGCGGMMGYKKY